MEITPLSGALGAVITGIDLTRATDPELKELEQAFLDTPGGRAHWQQWATAFPEDFRSYVEEEVLRPEAAA